MTLRYIIKIYFLQNKKTKKTFAKLRKWSCRKGIRENAKAIGLGIPSTVAFAHRFNLVYRSNRLCGQVRKIKILRKAGFTFQEISKLYGVTPQHIQQVFKKNA